MKCRKLVMALVLVMAVAMATVVSAWTPWAAWAFAGQDETLIILQSAPGAAEICAQESGAVMGCRTITELREWLCTSTTGCAPGDPTEPPSTGDRGGGTIDWAHGTSTRR